MMKKILNRLYEDFLLPSRLNDFRQILNLALEEGYRFITIRDLWRETDGGKIPPRGKCFVLRHDIDTDAKTARLMWEIELELGIHSSYYFRLTTLDYTLMKEIENEGGEASYHFEEVATFAKRNGLKSSTEIEKALPAIRTEFLNNLSRLRSATGLPMSTVAAHGDFVNRSLGITNSVILKDDDCRRSSQIEVEVYDKAITQYNRSRHSDAAYPKLWAPNPPAVAIRSGSSLIYVLVHPKHWKSNGPENFKCNWVRLREGLAYRLG